MDTRSIHEAEVERAGERAAKIVQPTAANAAGQPVSILTGIVKHGGLYVLLDADMTEERMKSVNLSVMAGKSSQQSAQAIKKHIKNYFSYLVHPAGKPSASLHPYKLHASLVSYLTQPGSGRTFSSTNEPSPEVLAAFTFVGQFIDHDLTLNAMNLFDPQGAGAPGSSPVVDEASPLLDLDHVYGPRVDDAHPDNLRQTSMRKDGFFGLEPVKGPSPDMDGFDVCRQKIDAKQYLALIGDKRNDENQIILQVHILVMRLHNAFMRALEGKVPPAKIKDEARRLTTLSWQCMVVTEYLPLVAQANEIKRVLDHVGKNDGVVKYVPLPNPERSGKMLRMPHEFAIGFRFGHSQLRSRYRLNPRGSFPLFDNVANNGSDLQGSRPLAADRLIDWKFFLGQTADEPDHSNLIDTHVTNVVFDLPESTIPDEVTLVGDLPFRNLARSDKLGLCAGEDLAKFYGITPLAHDQVDAGRPDLFSQEPPSQPTFRTPLWYYLLREAEIDRPSGSLAAPLGKLGSRLVAEVILSGIYYAPISFLQAPAWGFPAPVLGNYPHNVTLWDLAKFATASSSEPPCENDH